MGNKGQKPHLRRGRAQGAPAGERTDGAPPGNPKVGQKLLNHSPISVTAKYAHVLDTEVADAMERVAKTPEIRKGGIKGNGE